MALLLPTRWQKQPQTPVEIDWSHPLARNLTGAWIFNTITPINLVDGTKSVQSTATGHALTTTQKASKRLQIGGMSLKLDDSRRKLLADSAGSILHFCGGMEAVTGNAFRRGFSSRDIIGYNHGAGGVLSGTRIFYNNVSISITSTVSIAAEKKLVFTYGATGTRIYQNGVLNTSNATAITLSSDSDFSIGNSAGVSTEEPQYPNEILLTWDRVLTENEARLISLNPYVILRPQQRRLWVKLLDTSGDFNLTLPSIDIEFDGIVLGVGDIAGEFDLSLPSLDVSFDGLVGLVGDFSMSMPAIDITLDGGSYTFGSFNFPFPSIGLQFSGIAGVRGGIELDFAPLDIAFDGAVGSIANIDLDFPLIDIAFDRAPDINLDFVAPDITFIGLTGQVGSFNLPMPMIDINFNGLISLLDGFNLPMPSIDINFNGLVGVAGSFDLDISAIDVQMNGFTGTAGSFDLTLPVIDVEFNAGSSVSASINLTMPSIGLEFSGNNTSQQSNRFYNRHTR